MTRRIDMEPSTPTTRTIEVDEHVYDVLTRTATTRDTDINGALRYLIEAPAVPAASNPDDDEE
jgi:hypothetical protein